MGIIAKYATFMLNTVEAKLTAAIGEISALTAERDDLRATVEKLTANASVEIEAAKVEAAAKDAKIAELADAIEAHVAKVGELTAKVQELETSKVSASKEAAKIVASTGINPIPLPLGDAPNASAVNHAAIHASLPAGSKERADYFAKHKAAIVSGN